METERELKHFYIGTAFGGSQSWFMDPMMRIGGCAAAAACDLSIDLALHHDRRSLYPYDLNNLTRRDYTAFAMKMKPYIRPRFRGVDRTSIFIDGYGQYLRDCGVHDITMTSVEGSAPESEAEAAVRRQLCRDIPVPYLVLRHKDPELKDYYWHWFLLVGFREKDDDLLVKTATYGEAEWISFQRFWDTGFEERGGLVLLN